MCVNQKWIVNRYTKERVYVKCGRCPACQQEKANKRALRINMETKFNVPHDWITAHVILTYKNDFIPFIKDYHYDQFMDFKRSHIPVYRIEHKRLSRLRYKDKDGVSHYKKRSLRIMKCINMVDGYDRRKSPDSKLKTNFLDYAHLYRLEYGEPVPGKSLPHLRYKISHNRFKYDDCRIGVLNYNDIQNFIKSLKYYVKGEKFSYFSCGEYGPDPESIRPHYHLSLSFRRDNLELFKKAIAASWKFDNIVSNWRNQFKLHNGAATYLASYVNCPSEFPLFFKTFRPFSPSHNYSYGYGMVSDFCQLPSVLEMARKGRFEYERIVTISGVKQLVKLPLPSYVVFRYFPKFKGYSLLSTGEIFSVVRFFPNIYNYAKRLDLTDEQADCIRISLHNHFVRYCRCLGIDINLHSLELYAQDYLRVHNSYYSFINIFAYEKIEKIEDLLYRFVNWSDYPDHPFVSLVNEFVEVNFLEDDPNNYPLNQLLTKQLETQYKKMYKKRKVRNSLILYEKNLKQSIV